MRKFTVPYVSLHDVPDDLADCDGSCCNDGDGVPRFLDGGGLCCPDDLLDAVMPHVPDVDDVFMDTDVVISSLFPKADVLLTDTGSGGGAPLLPAAHASPSASSLTTSTVYSGCQSSTTTRETDSPAPVLRLPDLTVPRKKRHRPVRRRNQFWPPPPLDCTLAASAPFAPHDNPIGNDGEYSSGNNVGGGSIRRRVVARRRNRNSQRVCSHCDNRDTPQWRAGPDGPGTLCNACGIRYAMNKLLPEYRPSTSPSFRSDKHSNRHRKVVKLREQKDHEKMLKAMDGATAVPMAATYVYHHVNDIQSI